MLIIVIGLPGTGKSTVSKYLAEKLNTIILNADEFRAKLFNINSSEKDKIFPDSQRDAPYYAMFLEAANLIKKGSNVIIDAALYSNELVDKAKSITNNSRVIQTVCPEEIVKKRLRERMKGGEYSAGVKVYEFMKSLTEDISADIVLDTSLDWKELI